MKVSECTIRKYGARGKWHWRASVTVTDDSGSKRYTKMLCECDPPTEAEKDGMKKRRRTVLSGKGSATAKADADKWRAELVAELEAKQVIESLPKPSQLSVKEYVSFFNKTKTKVGAATKDGYKYLLAHLDYPMLDKSIRELTPDDVLAWKSAMEENGIGDSIQAKTFSRLRGACAWAINMGHRLPPNPCASIPAPKPRLRDPNPLDDDGIKRLNAELDKLPATRANQDFVCAVKLALLTGMRRGELCGLKWGAVDGWNRSAIAGNIHIRNVICEASKESGGTYEKPYAKNGELRDIRINPDIAALLTARRTQLREDRVALGMDDDISGEYVLGKAGGAYMTPSYLSHRWRLFADMTGIMGASGYVLRFHDLRHTFCTHALASGLDLATVAGIAGHRDPSVTLRKYARFLPSRAADGMQQMTGHFTQTLSEAELLDFKAAANG